MKNRKKLTYLSYLYLVSYAFTTTSIGACNKPIAVAFHLKDNAMGMLLAWLFGGFVVASLICSYFIQRRGIKKTMLGSIAILGLALVGTGLSWNSWILFPMMLCIGIGGGAVEGAVNALIAEMYPDTRVSSLNLMHIYFGVGAFTWPLIAGFLLASGISWRAIFIILGIYSIAIGALIASQKFPASKSHTSDSSGLRDMFRLITSPAAFLIALMVAFYVGGEMGINSWIVRYFDEVILHNKPLSIPVSLTPAGIPFRFVFTSTMFLTIFWLTLTLGRIATAIAGKYLPDTTILRIETLLSTIFAIATFYVSNIFLAGIFLALTGFFFSGIFATAIATGGNRYPSQIGAVSSLIIGFSGLGNIALNAGIGVISNSWGLRTGMMTAALFLIVMTICAFLIPKTPLLKN